MLFGIFKLEKSGLNWCYRSLTLTECAGLISLLSFTRFCSFLDDDGFFDLSRRLKKISHLCSLFYIATRMMNTILVKDMIFR